MLPTCFDFFLKTFQEYNKQKKGIIEVFSVYPELFKPFSIFPLKNIQTLLAQFDNIVIYYIKLFLRHVKIKDNQSMYFI